jgi:hypothetical protein
LTTTTTTTSSRPSQADWTVQISPVCIYGWVALPPRDGEPAPARGRRWVSSGVTHAMHVTLRRAGSLPIRCSVVRAKSRRLSFTGMREDEIGMACREDVWEEPRAGGRAKPRPAPDGVPREFRALGAGEFVRRMSPLIGAERASKIVEDVRRALKWSEETSTSRRPWEFALHNGTPSR